jgi:hypothetical protein
MCAKKAPSIDMGERFAADKLTETAHHAPGACVGGRLVERLWQPGSQLKNAWQRDGLGVL